MNSYITSQNIALGVVYLRNSRAHVPDKYYSGRLDGDILTRKLLRPKLISSSQASADSNELVETKSA